MKVHSRIPEGRANLTVTVDDVLRAYIKYRSERLGWSMAQFVEPIIQDWVARGCPPVGEVDRLVSCISFDQFQKQGGVDPKVAKG